MNGRAAIRPAAAARAGWSCNTLPAMSASGFAIFCMIGFLVPVPILAWLDRPRGGRAAVAKREDEPPMARN